MMRQEHERLIGIPYDVVIRARADLGYTRPIEFSNYDLRYVITPEEFSFGAVSDVLAFGASSIMTRFCCFYCKMRETYDAMRCEIDPHNFLLAWFHYSGIEGRKFPLGIDK